MNCKAFLTTHTSARIHQAIRSARPAVSISPDKIFDSPKCHKMSKHLTYSSETSTLEDLRTQDAGNCHVALIESQ